MGLKGVTWLKITNIFLALLGKYSSSHEFLELKSPELRQEAAQGEH